MFYEDLSFENFLDSFKNLNIGVINLILIALILIVVVYLLSLIIEDFYLKYKSKNRTNNSILLSKKLFNEVQN